MNSWNLDNNIKIYTTETTVKGISKLDDFSIRLKFE